MDGVMIMAPKPPRPPAPPVSKHNVTSIDVARLAEVLQSAVSRTFTPGASVAQWLCHASAK